MVCLGAGKEREQRGWVYKNKIDECSVSRLGRADEPRLKKIANVATVFLSELGAGSW